MSASSGHASRETECPAPRGPPRPARAPGPDPAPARAASARRTARASQPRLLVDRGPRDSRACRRGSRGAGASACCRASAASRRSVVGLGVPIADTDRAEGEPQEDEGARLAVRDQVGGVGHGLRTLDRGREAALEEAGHRAERHARRRAALDRRAHDRQDRPVEQRRVVPPRARASRAARGAAMRASPDAVTGTSLGSAVVPLVVAKATTGSAVSTAGSPATMRRDVGPETLVVAQRHGAPVLGRRRGSRRSRAPARRRCPRSAGGAPGAPSPARAAGRAVARSKRTSCHQSRRRSPAASSAPIRTSPRPPARRRPARAAAAGRLARGRPSPARSGAAPRRRCPNRRPSSDTSSTSRSVPYDPSTKTGRSSPAARWRPAAARIAVSPTWLPTWTSSPAAAARRAIATERAKPPHFETRTLIASDGAGRDEGLHVGERHRGLVRHQRQRALGAEARQGRRAAGWNRLLHAGDAAPGRAGSARAGASAGRPGAVGVRSDRRVGPSTSRTASTRATSSPTPTLTLTCRRPASRAQRAWRAASAGDSALIAPP